MMRPKSSFRQAGAGRSDSIDYIREMLTELRNVAEAEGCDMLCYLLEMAYLEASEIQNGRQHS